MGNLEYFEKYLNEKKRPDSTLDDYIVYNSRAFPFFIAGGGSVLKTYYFVQSSKIKLKPNNLDTIVLKLHIKIANKEIIVKTHKYYLRKKYLNENYTFADILE